MKWMPRVSPPVMWIALLSIVACLLMGGNYLLSYLLSFVIDAVPNTTH